MLAGVDLFFAGDPGGKIANATVHPERKKEIVNGVVDAMH